MLYMIDATTNTTPSKSTNRNNTLKFLGAHSNQTKISIWIDTTTYLPRNLTYFFLFFFPRLDRYRKWKHPNTSRKPGYFFFLYRKTSRNPDIFFFNTTSHQGIWAIIPFILYHKTTRNLGIFFLVIPQDITESGQFCLDSADIDEENSILNGICHANWRSSERTFENF